MLSSPCPEQSSPLHAPASSSSSVSNLSIPTDTDIQWTTALYFLCTREVLQILLNFSLRLCWIPSLSQFAPSVQTYIIPEWAWSTPDEFDVHAACELCYSYITFWIWTAACCSVASLRSSSWSFFCISASLWICRMILVLRRPCRALSDTWMILTASSRLGIGAASGYEKYQRFKINMRKESEKYLTVLIHTSGSSIISFFSRMLARVAARSSRTLRCSIMKYFGIGISRSFWKQTQKW